VFGLNVRVYFSHSQFAKLQLTKEIRRIVVKVCDPADFLGDKIKHRDAISMDNGCNFAAAMAKVADDIDHEFFYQEYRNRYHVLYLMSNFCRSRPALALSKK
jgi:hypothetical protein